MSLWTRSCVQVSFQESRSFEEQITHIVKAIEDGFQQRPMKYWILTLHGFNQTYNTVWQQKLPLHMLNTGISSIFIHWFSSFLVDHRDHVQLYNVFSSSRPFNQVLLQGLILARLLLLFYFIDLAKYLSDDAVIALFKDNVSILQVLLKLSWK